MRLPRLRFAPSPTGFLHIGGLRTALYNYMFAKQNHGKVFLRIEDTDQSRLVPGAIERMMSILKWNGIYFDEYEDSSGTESFVLQSKRLPIYQRHADILLKNGSAYRCFCSKRRLSILKKSQQALKEFPRYDNKCRHLTANEISENIENNVSFVVRLKLPESDISFEDMLHGPSSIDFRVSGESDPVLLKSEGFPTYHLANVVDDHLMDISHVLRGVEWLPSTGKHMLLYHAFKWKPPQFAHLPLLVNLNGTKLSKRQGDVFVEQYKNKGYFAGSLLNFVCTGSGFQHINLPIYGDEISSAESIIKQLSKSFNLQRVLNSPSVSDFAKLNEFSIKINTHICESESGLNHLTTQLWREVKKYYGDNYLIEMSENEKNIYLKRICKQQMKRVTVLQDLIIKHEYLWKRPKVTEYNFLNAKEIIEIAMNVLDNESSSTKDIMEKLTKEIKTLEIKFSEAMKWLRICLTGNKVGPSVGELVEVLGKEETMYRLDQVNIRLNERNNSVLFEQN